MVSALWLLLLLLPNAATLALSNQWETRPWQLLAASVWTVLALWLLVPRRLGLVITAPLVFAGLAVLGAEALRGADLLELVRVRYTFQAHEVGDVLGPYRVHALILALAIAAGIAAQWRRPRPCPPQGTPSRFAVAGDRVARSVRLGLVGIGCVLALLLPPQAWRSAWPINLVDAWVAGSEGDLGLGVPDMQHVRASPRDRGADWGATRAQALAQAETVVLVIGESVRADRVPGCGGRDALTAVPADALLYCDVLAGAGSTHVSVPLLVSRDRPGARERIARDATVARAFEAVGFETFWLSTQERSIAWADARNQAYDNAGRLDREILLPMLDAALARPAARKFIVLHAYNAHGPYRERYRAQNAPFAVDRARMGQLPSRDALAQWWNDYDNALDESLRFLAAVIARVRGMPGTAFVLYTPDHGENMLDDARGLTQHALKEPTLWDTRVPAVAWANDAWRRARPQGWSMLQANREAALMHTDMAPTLLGAAGIAYHEPRLEVVDLTSSRAGPRVRSTHLRAGESATEAWLVQQAGRLAPPD